MNKQISLNLIRAWMVSQIGYTGKGLVQRQPGQQAPYAHDNGSRTHLP
jgi:hypothetical protein